MSKRDLINLGKNIKFYRKQEKLSQERLAELIKRSRNYVGIIERAEINLPIDTLFDISKALHVNIKNFFE